MKKTAFCLVGTFGFLFLNGPAEAGMVKAAPGGRAAYDGTLALEFAGDCWSKHGEIEKYKEIDGLPCYRTSYDVAATAWIAPNGMVYNMSSECEPDSTEVPQIGTYKMTTEYRKGYNYWGQHLNCPRGDDGTYESKTGTFEVYRACPATVALNFVEGEAFVDGKKTGDGVSVTATSEISTGKNGKVEIEFYDGTIVRLGPNSKMKMECTEDKEFTVHMKMRAFFGDIWSKVNKIAGSERTYETRNERFVAGVRGTVYETIQTGNEVRVVVEEGAVLFGRFTNDPDAILVRDCEAARIVGSGKPERIAPFDTENIFCGN